MKRNLFAFIVIAIFLASCAVPNDVTTDAKTETTTAEETTPNTATSQTGTTDSVAIQTTDGIRYVKNSLWKNCSLEYLVAKKAGRSVTAEISAGDLQNIVDGLNATENDNQYFVEETDTDITESPTINVYIVNEANPTDGSEPWSILGQYLDWPRSDYAARPQAFKDQAEILGGILYVDKIPPKPEPVIDTRTEHEKNQLTIYSANTGKIIYSENCLDEYDGTNFASLAQCYEMRYYAYSSTTEDHNIMTIYKDDQWVFIAGHYYTEPAETTE
jgi:hypothetical protein